MSLQNQHVQSRVSFSNGLTFEHSFIEFCKYQSGFRCPGGSSPVTELVEFLQQHDVGIIAFVYSKKERLTVGRERQTANAAKWLLESEDLCWPASCKVEVV